MTRDDESATLLARIATLEAELVSARLDADLAWKESGELSKERNEEAYQWMAHANALRDALADERRHADALAVELMGALGACDDDLGWEYTQNCYDDAGRALLAAHAARRGRTLPERRCRECDRIRAKAYQIRRRASIKLARVLKEDRNNGYPQAR